MYTYCKVSVDRSHLHRVICALIDKQQHLANSTDLSVRFRTLWTAALLNKHLNQCTDREIGKLLVIVQDQFHILEPEIAILYHAQRRLLRRP
jgi:hypothetical protein